MWLSAFIHICMYIRFACCNISTFSHRPLKITHAFEQSIALTATQIHIHTCCCLYLYEYVRKVLDFRLTLPENAQSKIDTFHPK